MRIDFHGLVFQTPSVTFYLWSPWRSTAIEHRLFEAIRQITGTRFEEDADELRLHVTEPKTFRAAVQAVSRVLKGWQEEADPGRERRAWWWLIEGDTNADGYDHNGERFTLWAFIRVAIERGGPGDGEKGEDIDLDGFWMQISGEDPQTTAN